MYQSGFRAQHGVETAVNYVTSDLLLARHIGETVVLVALNLYSAFDLVSIMIFC